MQTRRGRWQLVLAIVAMPIGVVLAALGLAHSHRAPWASPWFDVGWLLLILAIWTGVRAYGGHNLVRLLVGGTNSR